MHKFPMICVPKKDFAPWPASGMLRAFRAGEFAMSVLKSAKVCAFIATRDREKAKAFYGETLGFTLQSEDPYGVVFQMQDASLRITPLPDFTPQQHTALGWNVADVTATVTALTAAGIVFERYSFLEQDELGVWNSGEAQVAWFKDPDGNVLSISSG